jgi:F like protein
LIPNHTTVQTTIDARESYRETRRTRAIFAKTKAIERSYAAKLRKIAAYVGTFISGFDATDPTQMGPIQDGLRRYSELLLPWSRSVAQRMLVEVARRDENAWFQYGRLMGVELRREIHETPIGNVLRELLDEQVNLITSIPIEAGRRVHRLAIESRISGGRASDLAAEIVRTAEVTKSRAMLIARTETARAASGLTQARAVAIGSTHYVWRSMEDSDVRPRLGIKHFAQLNTLAHGSHRKLNGTIQSWSSPPIAGVNGERAHPGGIYRCRCYPEPILPSQYG